jgi:two-component system, chemotaxis family, sensor kinase CheA
VEVAPDMRINSQRVDSLDYRIMVLDDDIAIVDSLSTLLRKSGFEITGITDPEEAVDKICMGKYDMLILDYMMDKMNGDKVVEKVRGFNKEIYILLLTGHKDLVPPLKTLKSLEIQGYCEKGDKVDQLILLIESGIKAISQMNSIKKIKDEMNSTLKQMVAQQNIELKNLLNNVGQGFLTFSQNLNVDPEFSYECINIFKRNIELLYFPDLIYPNDEEKKKLLESILINAMDIKNKFRRDVFISVLPEVVEIEGKFIHFEYKIINSPLNDGTEKFMLILTDITEKCSLENQIEQEKAILEMVVKAVAENDILIDLVKDYKRFYSIQLYEILESDQPLKDIIFEIYRLMHNFKGNFGQLYMVNIIKLIHDLESDLSLMLKDLNSTNIDDFKKFIVEKNISGWLDKDLAVITDVLGENFINKEESVVIDKHKLYSFEREIESKLSPPEYKLVSKAIRQLQYKPIRNLFKSYPGYLEKMSQKYEKPITEFKIDGGDFPVDIEKYRSVANSLIHIFKNILDHGLETPEERVEKGKDEYGCIKCKIVRSDNTLSIIISDDGRGIDYEKIKEKALHTGLISKDECNDISSDTLINILFKEGFTTTESATMFSGRGMGLSIVREEIDKIGGTIEIDTLTGVGTKFIFEMPVYDE